MSTPPRRKKAKGPKKVRVAFKRNRSAPPRCKGWTEQARQAEEHEVDSVHSETVVAKGDLSRRRTIIIRDEEDDADPGLCRGTVVALRGLYVEVDDGQRIWPCTIRRVLRTRLITQRHPVTVGDHVRFRIEDPAEGVEQEGVVEIVEPRQGELLRQVGKRIQTIVANVDNAVIVTSAGEPTPKPHLIDRYIVASLAGEITPVVCMNKVDLDCEGRAVALLKRYSTLGIRTLATSVVTGEGIDTLRNTLKGTSSVIAGQSGVGKSSLLNVVQPGLKLRTGDISAQSQRGRHTTTTASMIRLDVGGYVVDTPGVRSFDLATVPRNEFEAYFVEFVEHVRDCKFPDCTHTHEIGCAVKAAVERGEIHPDRYDSYVRLFEEPPEQ